MSSAVKCLHQTQSAQLSLEHVPLNITVERKKRGIPPRLEESFTVPVLLFNSAVARRTKGQRVHRAAHGALSPAWRADERAWYVRRFERHVAGDNSLSGTRRAAAVCCVLHLKAAHSCFCAQLCRSPLLKMLLKMRFGWIWLRSILLPLTLSKNIYIYCMCVCFHDKMNIFHLGVGGVRLMFSSVPAVRGGDE